MKNLSIRNKLMLSFVMVLLVPMILGPTLLVALYLLNRSYADSVGEISALGGLVARNTTLSGTLIAVCVAGIVVMLLLAVYFIRRVSRAIREPAREMVEVARAVARGDVDVQIHYQSDDELGQLGDAFRQMISAVREQAGVIQQLAEGDFSAAIASRSERDAVNRAVARLIQRNNEMLHEIRSASEQVAVASGQIAQGAQTLASGSSQQAATMERFTQLLEEVHRSSEENAGLADSAVAAARDAGVLMDHSTGSMQKLIESMRAIEDSSQDITRVIKVIDEIAFQTNILALNAAVEAARAGQHGKGFAVVADEVRSLASKSAEAARETAALIEGSSAQVQHGRMLVAETAGQLEETAGKVRTNAGMVEQIATASQLQKRSIDEINAGVLEMGSVVQANAATAEESAAAAEEMSAQSSALREIVGSFHLREDEMRVQGTVLPELAMEEEFPPPPPEEAGFALGYDKYA